VTSVWIPAYFSRPMIEIDGSHGEGGGQIVRTACSLAVVAGKPCRIFNIRQRREAAGLKLQHLLALRALAELCDGRLDGDQIGSSELAFYPGKVARHDLQIKIATAGSITLILQCLIPAILATSKPVTVSFEGGATDTSGAPPLDYFQHVFVWFLRCMGLEVKIQVSRRGYYPKGGSLLTAEIIPAPLKSIRATERGALRRISLFSSSSHILRRRKVAERQIEGALSVLQSASLLLEPEVDYVQSVSPGSSICIVAEFERTVVGASALGAIRKSAEDVGKEAGTLFSSEIRSSAALDRHMADQILPYLALMGAGARVTVSEITRHCRTNMWVIEKFLPGKFELEGNEIRWMPELQAF
jgi:RNA 3'-terminal phosphate cyclase (GTP)